MPCPLQQRRTAEGNRAHAPPLSSDSALGGANGARPRRVPTAHRPPPPHSFLMNNRGYPSILQREAAEAGANRRCGMETVAAADATFHTALLARGYRLVTGNHYEAPSGNDTPLSGDLLVPGTGGHRLERIEYARVRLRRHPHLTLALASDSGAGAGPRPQSPGRPGLALGAPAILIREEPPTSHAVRNPTVHAWLAMRARIARIAPIGDDRGLCSPRSGRLCGHPVMPTTTHDGNSLRLGCVAAGWIGCVFVSPGLNPLPSWSSVRLEPCCAFRREATEGIRSFFVHSAPACCDGVALPTCLAQHSAASVEPGGPRTPLTAPRRKVPGTQPAAAHAWTAPYPSSARLRGGATNISFT